MGGREETKTGGIFKKFFILKTATPATTAK